MSSPSMSRRKPWPWIPPPLENATSKSKLTRLSVTCLGSLEIPWLRIMSGTAHQRFARGIVGRIQAFERQFRKRHVHGRAKHRDGGQERKHRVAAMHAQPQWNGDALGWTGGLRT